ncbi:MAG: glycosyl transferase family 2 [Deltaproteobacteria bacterium RBG_16_48_10]|nr:MAG: glycosyl transferase family 2 [Deltaproteobacteria bacterium RBG_16_48_10]
MDLSVVIPLYNETHSLQELFQALKSVFNSLGKSYEIIFVDDGSTDDSFSILKEIFTLNDHVQVIRLRRNFGKTAAFLAGFTEAQGRIVITLDADLQDSPTEIPLLLRKLEEGYDFVSGWKRERKDGWMKRVSSKIFNRVVSYASGIKIHDFNCGLKVFKREVIEELELYGEMHRFIPALVGWRGFKIGEVTVKHSPRKYGKSKFGSDRYLKGLLDFLTVMMLVKYIKRPLHLFGSTGLLIGSIGLIINLYLTIGWLFKKWIGYRPLLMLGVLLMIIGVQTVFFGLLAEMMNFLSPKGIGPSVAQILRKK